MLYSCQELQLRTCAHWLCRPCALDHTRSPACPPSPSTTSTARWLCILIQHPCSFCVLVQAVASLASLTGLEDLRLADCGAITNNGMDVLSSLTRLTALAVVRCPRIADKGLTLLTCLPRLRHLDVTGCSKVGQRGILAGQIHRQNLVPEL